MNTEQVLLGIISLVNNGVQLYRATREAALQSRELTPEQVQALDDMIDARLLESHWQPPNRPATE